MEISYLNEFIKVTQTNNFLQAADELFISQSSLSKHIQSIEKELGAELFSRTTRKVSLTDSGKAFLPFAKVIVENYEKGVKVAKENAKDDLDSIKIGIIPSIDSYRITDMLSEFSNSHKSFKLVTTEGDTIDIVKNIKNKECNLGFVYDCEELDDSFIKIPFAKDVLVLVVPKSNPLSSLKEVDIHQLENEHCLVLESHTCLKRASFKVFEDANIKAPISYTQRRFLSGFDLQNDQSIAFFFKKDATYVNNPRNVIVALAPKVTINLYLCYLKSHDLTLSEKAFIDFVSHR